MRTIIFILALSAIAAPALAGAGDAINCAPSTPPLTCNKCIEGSDGNPTTECFDCKDGYYLSYTAGSTTTGACLRCNAGTGMNGGTAAVGATSANRPTSKTAADCSACASNCAQCLLGSNHPNGGSSCTRCAAGRWTENFADGTGACSELCTSGKTRDVASADLTGTETRNGVCTADCTEAGCFACKGTGTGKCTWCKYNYYTSAFTQATQTGTCTHCPSTKYRPTQQSGQFSGTETEGDVCTGMCDASCDLCDNDLNTSCLRCAANRYATNFASGTATCAACDQGTTRAVGTAFLTANEVKNTVCLAPAPAGSGSGSGSGAGASLTCDVSCATCRGTATACTKCAAGYFLSARTSTETTGTCSPCTEGKGKDADASEFTTTTAIVTKTACTATCTAASNCDSCSAAEPAKCTTCAAGSTLDATTKTCSKPAAQGSSASLLQAICGATIATYALL